MDLLSAQAVREHPDVALCPEVSHARLVVGQGHDLDLEEHVRVVFPAQLGALALKDADLGGNDLEPVDLARYDVELAQELRHPEGVADISGGKDELHPPVHGKVERQQSGDNSRLAGQHHHGRGLEGAGVDVVEVPVPLFGDNVDRDVRLRGDVHLRRLEASGVEEQDRDHEHGHDRVEDLDRHVVTQLLGQSDVVLLATVGHHAPQDQPPDQHADAESRQPGTVPEGDDAAALTGHALRQETALDRVTTATQGHHAGHS